MIIVVNERCDLSGIGHPDASRPQRNLGRQLRVVEGEIFLVGLLSHGLQNEVALGEPLSEWAL